MTPLEARDNAEGEEGLRVKARMWTLGEEARREVMTAPPCFPVAPTTRTVGSGLVDIWAGRVSGASGGSSIKGQEVGVLLYCTRYLLTTVPGREISNPISVDQDAAVSLRQQTRTTQNSITREKDVHPAHENEKLKRNVKCILIQREPVHLAQV